MPVEVTNLLQLLADFFAAWQVRGFLVLVLLDVVLGVAAALRTGVFEWGKLGNFYKTTVLPYGLGFLVVYVTIGFLLPADAPAGGLGDFPPVNLGSGAITVAWLALVAHLGSSIMANWNKLYNPSG